MLPNLAENARAIATDDAHQRKRENHHHGGAQVCAPKDAAQLALSDIGNEGASGGLRWIHIVDGASGVDDNNQVRMVKTPWSENEIPLQRLRRLARRR